MWVDDDDGSPDVVDDVGSFDCDGVDDSVDWVVADVVEVVVVEPGGDGSDGEPVDDESFEAGSVSARAMPTP